MKLEQLNSLEKVKRFLNRTDIVAFNVVTTRQERHQGIQKALKKHRYRKLRKPHKGAVAQYLMEITGYSRTQIKRLIQPFVKHEGLEEISEIPDTIRLVAADTSLLLVSH